MAGREDDVERDSFVGEGEADVGEDAHLQEVGARDGVAGSHEEEAFEPPPDADPAQLLKARSVKRRAFTAVVNRMSKGIDNKVAPEDLDRLYGQLTDLYEEAICCHLQYCGATNRDVEAWVADLDTVVNDTHQRIKTYKHPFTAEGSIRATSTHGAEAAALGRQAKPKPTASLARSDGSGRAAARADPDQRGRLTTRKSWTS